MRHPPASSDARSGQPAGERSGAERFGVPAAHISVPLLARLAKASRSGVPGAARRKPPPLFACHQSRVPFFSVPPCLVVQLSFHPSFGQRCRSACRACEATLGRQVGPCRSGTTASPPRRLHCTSEYRLQPEVCARASAGRGGLKARRPLPPEGGTPTGFRPSSPRQLPAACVPTLAIRVKCSSIPGLHCFVGCPDCWLLQFWKSVL